MDIDISPNSMRIRGKAWEIKAKLRDLAGSQLLLEEFLTRQTTNKKKIISFKGNPN